MWSGGARIAHLSVAAMLSLVFIAAQILFAVAFFVCRVLLGPFVVYYTLQSSTSNPVVKVRP